VVGWLCGGGRVQRHVLSLVGVQVFPFACQFGGVGARKCRARDRVLVLSHFHLPSMFHSLPR
jgi:hypothetical protein